MFTGRPGRWPAWSCSACSLSWFSCVPFWTEFRFYNWQMSVVRKPAYTLRALVDRASWVPIVHDFFTRQYPLLLLALIRCLGLLRRWTAPPAERLLGLWVGLGLSELVLHDVGNERRFVFFIPAFVAIAALVLGRDRHLLPRDLATIVLARATHRVAVGGVRAVYHGGRSRALAVSLLRYGLACDWRRHWPLGSPS